MPTLTPTDLARPRVLVIDDDRLLAAGIRRGLQDANDVEVEHDPIVALARLRDGSPFDVILCDLMMPTLSGIELYQELGRTHPELTPRIVFVSGGAYTDRAARFMADSSNRRIDKPYRLQHLRQVVEDVAFVSRGARPPRSTRTA